MSTDHDLAPAERRARQAVRDLPRPEAGHAFRERLKRDFVTGRIGERRALHFGAPGVGRTIWRWALAPVVAVVLVVAAITLDRAPGWQVAGREGQGTLTVDGRPARDAAELARLLRPGVRVHTPQGVTLRLASAGFGMIELTPGADMRLPAPPGRWIERAVRAEVQSGVVRFSTAAAFHGARLSVRTPETEVQITGTTFAVLCMPMGTCVCVLEGRVLVGEHQGAAVRVEPGHRREIFNTGEPPLSDRMLPDQIAPLRALHAECGRRMPAGR